jgi:hypothetical protein
MTKRVPDLMATKKVVGRTGGPVDSDLTNDLEWKQQSVGGAGQHMTPKVEQIFQVGGRGWVV